MKLYIEVAEVHIVGVTGTCLTEWSVGRIDKRLWVHFHLDHPIDGPLVTSANCLSDAASKTG